MTAYFRDFFDSLIPLPGGVFLLYHIRQKSVAENLIFFALWAEYSIITIPANYTKGKGAILWNL